jgi:hypothetical protein
MVLMEALSDLEPRWSGPWHENELDQLPEAPGVYCVCEYAPEDSRQGLSAIRPLFIGESENVRQAVMGSENWADWREWAQNGRGVCFGYQSAPPAKLELMQSAMIAYYRPPGNDQVAWV